MFECQVTCSLSTVCRVGFVIFALGIFSRAERAFGTQSGSFEGELLYELRHTEGRYDVTKYWLSQDSVRPPVEWLPVKVFNFWGRSESVQICRTIKYGAKHAGVFYSAFPKVDRPEVDTIVEAIQELASESPESLSLTGVIAAIALSTPTETELRKTLLLFALHLCLDRDCDPLKSRPFERLLSTLESVEEQGALVKLIRLAALIDKEEVELSLLSSLVLSLRQSSFHAPFVMPEGNRHRRRSIEIELKDRTGKYRGTLSDYEINESFRRGLLESLPRELRQRLFKDIVHGLSELRHNNRLSLVDYELFLALAIQCDSIDEADCVRGLLLNLGVYRDVFIFSKNQSLWHTYLTEKAIEDRMFRSTVVSTNWIGGSFFMSSFDSFQLKSKVGKEIEARIRSEPLP